MEDSAVLQNLVTSALTVSKGDHLIEIITLKELWTHEYELQLVAKVRNSFLKHFLLFLIFQIGLANIIYF